MKKYKEILKNDRNKYIDEHYCGGWDKFKKYYMQTNWRNVNLSNKKNYSFILVRHGHSIANFVQEIDNSKFTIARNKLDTHGSLWDNLLDSRLTHLGIRQSILYGNLILSKHNIDTSKVYTSMLTRAYTTGICMMFGYNLAKKNNSKEKKLPILFGHGDFIKDIFRELNMNNIPSIKNAWGYKVTVENGSVKEIKELGELKELDKYTNITNQSLKKNKNKNNILKN